VTVAGSNLGWVPHQTLSKYREKVRLGREMLWAEVREWAVRAAQPPPLAFLLVQPSR
jgi:hypothetical protein